MYYYVAVISQNPRALAETFDVARGDAFLLQLLLYRRCYGFDTDYGPAAAYDEKIGDTGKFPQVQQQDFLALPVVGNPGCFLCQR